MYLCRKKNERVCKHLRSIFANSIYSATLKHCVAYDILAEGCPDMTVAEARDLINQIEAELKEIPF